MFKIVVESTIRRTPSPPKWVLIWKFKFPLAPMGVLAPGSAHARPSAQPPINTSGNISAHVFGFFCGGGWNLKMFLINFPIFTWGEGVLLLTSFYKSLIVLFWVSNMFLHVTYSTIKCPEHVPCISLKCPSYLLHKEHKGGTDICKFVGSAPAEKFQKYLLLS